MLYSTTLRKSVFAFSGVLFGTIGFTQSPNLPEPGSTKAVIKSTTRFHSKGMLAYGGRMACKSPAVDVNFIYEYKTVGFQIFKSFDLHESTSPNNYLLAALYTKFKLSNKITFTPHLVAALDQSHSFAGRESDLAFVSITGLKMNQNFAVDHTMLVGDLIMNPEARDWVNRARIMFTSKHLDITTSLWHNNDLFDNDNYTSAAITIAYSRIKISEHFNLNFAITELGIVQTSNEDKFHKENNLVVTTSMQFVR